MGTSTGYLERAWADLTCDNDWWRSALLLGIANCAPIIGQITTSGYLYDWAKEAAWGLHRPLPYRVGNLRRRLTYGSFWLVITLIWVVPLLIAAGLLLLVPAAGRGLSFLFVLLAFLGIFTFAECMALAAVGCVIEIIISLCDTPFVYWGRKVCKTEE